MWFSRQEYWGGLQFPPPEDLPDPCLFRHLHGRQILYHSIGEASYNNHACRQSEWLLSKCLQTINAGEGVEKREPSYTVGWNANEYSHYGKQCGDYLKKTGNRTAIWPSNLTAGCTHWGNQNWKKHVHPNVHRSTVYNSQDMEATIALTVRTFVNKVMSLLFNTVSRFVTAILPRKKHLLILQLHLPSALILKLYKKMKPDTVSTFSPSICYKVIGPDAMIFVFWMLSFRPVFSLSSWTFIMRLFRSSSLSAIKVVLYVYLKLFIFPPATLIPIHPAQHFAWCTLHINYIKRVTIQPWHTPFPILNQSVIPCLVLLLLVLHTGFSGGR